MGDPKLVQLAPIQLWVVPNWFDWYEFDFLWHRIVTLCCQFNFRWHLIGLVDANLIFNGTQLLELPKWVCGMRNFGIRGHETKLFSSQTKINERCFFKNFPKKKNLFMLLFLFGYGMQFGIRVLIKYGLSTYKYKYGIIHHWFRNGWRQDDCIINDWNCIAIFYLTECKNHTPTPTLCSWNYFIFIIISQESLEMLFFAWLVLEESKSFAASD